ncbi:unnamed protein product [Rhizoctonia solani]|uniref:Uncharacterized protein n=1 Tax=Rhizoctonia solani TaxID=456999 RepID=A0A8H3AN62_9AGAM|nr:unnamed protein product [Rhizoctonia solani]
MRSASRPPSRSSSRHKKKPKVEPDPPYSHPIAPPGVAISRPTATQEWTIAEQAAYFKTLPPVLCPASPPPTFGSETVEQARRRSRQRVERMTKRLASLPLYQARHLVHLACTELKGPFKPGCKYWGTSIPEPEPLTPEELELISHPIERPIPYKPPRPIGALQLEIENPPRFSTPSAAGPSSTIITGPPTPFTPPSASQVPIELLPAKASAGRPLAPVDYDPPSPVRSPTPTPSLPPSRLGSVLGSRPPETPVSTSQRSFIANLEASRASSTRSRRTSSRSSRRGLKILPPSSQAAIDRVMSQKRAESRDQSPLLRYSQRATNGESSRLRSDTPQETPKQETPAPISQRESAETYTFNSEFSVERQIEEIGKFIEADIGM